MLHNAGPSDGPDLAACPDRAILFCVGFTSEKPTNSFHIFLSVFAKHEWCALVASRRARASCSCRLLARNLLAHGGLQKTKAAHSTFSSLILRFKA